MKHRWGVCGGMRSVGDDMRKSIWGKGYCFAPTIGRDNINHNVIETTTVVCIVGDSRPLDIVIDIYRCNHGKEFLA